MNTMERVGEMVLRRTSSAPTIIWEDGMSWMEIPAMKVPITFDELVEILRFGGYEVEVIKDGHGITTGWRVL